jgi:hypothetical protein
MGSSARVARVPHLGLAPMSASEQGLGQARLTGDILVVRNMAARLQAFT